MKEIAKLLFNRIREAPRGLFFIKISLRSLPILVILRIFVSSENFSSILSPRNYYFPPIYEVYMGKENHALHRIFVQFLPLHFNKHVNIALPDGLVVECESEILTVQVRPPSTAHIFF